MWDVIVVSASTQEHANSACDELRASSPDLLGAKLLAVADPSRDIRVGSGGAAINALLIVGEELSALGGLTTLSVEPLSTARIIILQLATSARGGSPHPCLPQALTAIPAVAAGTVISGVCLTLHVATKLLAAMPPGLTIASTDSVIALPQGGHLPILPLGADSAGVVVTLPLPLEDAKAHGVCVPVNPASNHGRLVPKLGRILYHGTTEQLLTVAAPDGTVAVYTGLLYLTAKTASRLLELHVRSPLDACTCLGIDSGTPPLKLDLHADVLAPLASTDEAFYLEEAGLPERRSSLGEEVGEEAGGGAAKAVEPRLQAARRVLWTGLRGDGGSGLGMLTLATISGARYLYLSTSAAHQTFLLRPPIAPSLTSEASVMKDSSPLPLPAPPTPLSMCSFLVAGTDAAWQGSGAAAFGCHLREGVKVGAGSALVYCSLAAGTVVGEGAYLYGIHTPPAAGTWPARIVAHEVSLSLAESEEVVGSAGGAVALLLRHTDDELHASAADTVISSGSQASGTEEIVKLMSWPVPALNRKHL